MFDMDRFDARWGIVLGIVALVALAGCADEGGTGDSELTAEEKHAQIMDHAEGVAADLDTVEEAKAAGYVPDEHCVPGMGVHWLHQPGQEGSYLDTTFEEDNPEAVIFLPEDGNFTDPDSNQFLGIEYLVFTEGTDMNSTETKPDFMGVPFHGPMEGHSPQMPWHVDFHIYLAEGYESPVDFPAAQPDKISCPEGTTPPQGE